MQHKHEHLIGILGYSDENDKKIIVYEHASFGSLDMHLQDVSLTWGKRLTICIGIARGLDYLHGDFVTKDMVIHRDIKSSNILLDGNMNAKIAHFGLSIIRQLNQEMVFNLRTIAGTKFYIDPQYASTGWLSKECDIYSFGVILFEIMFRRLVYSNEFIGENEHLGPWVKRLNREGRLDEIVFEGTKDQIVPQSLTTFQRIALQCLHDQREERPTAGELLIKLEKALDIQEKGMDIIRIPLEDIKCATDNFSDEKCIRRGILWRLYKGQLEHANEQKSIAAKRLAVDFDQGDHKFYQELEILSKFKHNNIIALEGYCDEMSEKLIVYEYASRESLDKWLNHNDLTWKKRLKIGIDVASGLDFLHGGVLRQEAVVHRDIKSSNIMLSANWTAKITDFRFSLISPINQEIDQVNVEADFVGTLGITDPLYLEMGVLTKESDIYSFGVVLFELLCGRSTYVYGNGNNLERLTYLVKCKYEEGKLDEMVFDGIKDQILPRSLTTFADIAYQCLHDKREERPTASKVVAQLNKAFEFQEDLEIWEPKLPSDYKQIIASCKTPEIYNAKTKKNLYEIFTRETILIQEDKELLWLDKNKTKNKYISALRFSYENKTSHRWRRMRRLTFDRVAMILNVTNLQIQIPINAHFLSPGFMYSVRLYFQFVYPIQSLALSKKKKNPHNLKYVNLKYKMGEETLHAYFARYVYTGSMSIELCRFINDKENNEFKILLESFSRYYCGSGPIYILSVELEAIDNVKLDEVDKLKEVHQVLRSNSHTGQLRQLTTDNEEIFGRSENHDEGEKLFELCEVNGKIHYMVSAKEILCDSSNVKLFKLKSSKQSRFLTVIEIQPQQVLRLKYKIEKSRLSQDTKYVCYLVFKLSEKCRGLHCPVKIRNILKNGKLYDFCYFRSPSPCNLHETERVPKQREDGWMEVSLHLINSSEDLKNEHFPVNLKLISFEGTMSGLIIEGLEFRPMQK